MTDENAAAAEPTEESAAGAEEASAAEKAPATSSTAEKLAGFRDQIAKGEKVFAELPEGKEPFSDGDTVSPPPFETPAAEGDDGAEEETAEGDQTEEKPAEAGEETAPEAEGPEAEGPEEDAEKKEAEPEPTFTVQLPGRGPDDPDVQVEVADKELADRVRQLRNGFERSFELRKRETNLRQLETEIAEVKQEAKDDPVGFVLEHVDPAHHVAIARQILANPKIWDAMREELAKWDLDPSSRTTFSETARADRAEQRVERERIRDTRGRINKAAALAGDAIISIAHGNKLDDARGGHFYSMAMKAVGEYMDEKRIVDLGADDIGRILDLQGVTDAFQVDTGKRAESAVPATSSEEGKRRKLTPPGPTPEEVAQARKTGAGMKRAVERKREVAAVATPGEGAAPPTLPIKPGQTVKERIAAARKGGLAAVFGK